MAEFAYLEEVVEKGVSTDIARLSWVQKKDGSPIRIKKIERDDVIPLLPPREVCRAMQTLNAVPDQTLTITHTMHSQTEPLLEVASVWENGFIEVCRSMAK